MKKPLLAIILLTSSSLTYAASSGFYAGLQLGYGDSGFDASHAIIPVKGLSPDFSQNSTDNFNVVSPEFPGLSYSLQPLTSYTSNEETNNIAGRLFVGYKFNSYFATEVGYSLLSNMNLKISGNQSSALTVPPNVSVPVNDLTGLSITQTLNNDLQERITDLTTRWIYPVQDPGLSFYGKLGAAYVNASQNAKLTDNVTATLATGTSSPTYTWTQSTISSSTHPVRPLVGGGIDFYINKNVDFELDGTYIVGSNSIPDIAIASLGAVYRFA